MTECFDYTQLDEIIIFKGADNSDVIEMSRNGKYINLKKDSEINKKYYRFDLQKKIFERVNFYKTRDTKITPVNVKNITGWFKDCKIVTKDLHFGRLVLFARHNSEFGNYRSPVRFIEHLGHPLIESVEQWEALGLKVKEINEFFSSYLEKRYCWYSGKYQQNDYRKLIFLGEPLGHNFCFYGGSKIRPSDLSKELLTYIKENYDTVDSTMLYYYKKHYNNGEYLIEKKLKKIGREPEFVGIFNYTTQYRYGGHNPQRWVFGTSDESNRIKAELIYCIKEYNLDLYSLCRWIKKQIHVDKNDCGYLFGGGHHYRDYLECEKELCDGAFSKMNKYPDNFRSQFHRVQEEFNIKVMQIDEEKFKNRSLDNMDLIYYGKKYCILLPKQTSDIHHEALILNHCVRTYIPKVIDGKSLIVFLRDVEDKTEPLITIEVVDGIVKQAYGKNDSRPTDEQLNFLKLWADKKELKLGCWLQYFNR